MPNKKFILFGSDMLDNLHIIDVNVSYLKANKQARQWVKDFGTDRKKVYAEIVDVTDRIRLDQLRPRVNSSDESWESVYNDSL